MDNNSWLGWCEPLDRADHYVRQTDIPKAIAWYKELTGEDAHYLAVCSQKDAHKNPVEFVVPDDIELIVQDGGLCSWQINLAARMPVPENRWITESQLPNKLFLVVEENHVAPTPAEKVVVADPPKTPDALPQPQQPISKLPHHKRRPPLISKLFPVDCRASKSHVIGRKRKTGEVSPSTLWRREHLYEKGKNSLTRITNIKRPRKSKVLELMENLI